MKITLNTFFNKYIVHPFSKDLKKSEKAVATVSSGFFLVSTLGLLHLRALRNEKKVKVMEPEPSMQAIVNEALEIEPQPVIEKKFTDQLSSQQRSLYTKLSPTEKALYETLHGFEGAFADLVLLLIKGKTIDFQADENNIVINLQGGPTLCRAMGFDLTAILPKQLILHKNEKEFTLQNSLSIEYNGIYIMKPESATLTPRGVRLHADFGWPAKITGRSKILDAPLSSKRVFELFS